MSGLYNMVLGINPLAGNLFGLLKITSNTIPRPRDAWLHNATPESERSTKPPELQICVYTRTGGGNRASYERTHPEFDAEYNPDGPYNDDIRALPGFIRDEDDDYDATYAKWYFKIPTDDPNVINVLTYAYEMLGDVPSSKERWTKAIDTVRNAPL